MSERGSIESFEDLKVTVIDFNVSRRFREKKPFDHLNSLDLDSSSMKTLLMMTHTGAAAFIAPEVQ